MADCVSCPADHIPLTLKVMDGLVKTLMSVQITHMTVMLKLPVTILSVHGNVIVMTDGLAMEHIVKTSTNVTK